MRSAVLAGVMALLLATSLGAAVALCRLAPMTVGEFTLLAPRSWRVQMGVDAERLATVSHPRAAPGSGPRLLLWSHRATAPTAPQAFLDAAKASPMLAGGAPVQNDLRTSTLRVGPLTGLRYAGVAYHPQNPDVASARVIAVLTLEGSRWWTLAMIVPFQVTPGSTLQRELNRLPHEANLFDQALASLKWRGLRFTGSHWTILSGPRVAKTPADRNAPVWFIDESTHRLRSLRVRREYDLDISDDKNPLHPRSLLSLAYRNLFGSDPGSDRITHESLQDLELWWMRFPLPQGGLERQWWHARSAAGVLAAELTCEADDLAQAQAWAIAALRSADLPVARIDVEAATQRGVDIVEACRDRFEKEGPPPARGWEIHQDRQTLGFVVERSRSLTDEQGRPWIEQSLLQAAGAPPGPMLWTEQLRRSNPRGDTFAQRTSRLLAQPDAGPGAAVGEMDVLTLEARQLAAHRRTDEGLQRLWTMQIVPNYLPPAFEDRWPIGPISTLSPGEGEALLWVSRGTGPPVPCWVAWHSNLRLQPVGWLDADQRGLDPTGLTISAEHPLPLTAGAASTVLATSTLDEIEDRFRWAQPVLRQWNSPSTPLPEHSDETQP